MAWADMRDRMHSRVVAHLKDGAAQYTAPAGGAVVSGVEVIIDHNLMQNGPEGVFRSDAVGITWRKAQLAAAQRGGVFAFGDAAYVVEETITDDGHMITAACMVQP